MSDDKAINLTKLTKRTGYGYSSLKAMKLPLICGKIRESDFWRILKQRQDAIEEARLAASSVERARQTLQDADTLDVPNNSNDQLTSLRRLAGCQPHSNG